MTIVTPNLGSEAFSNGLSQGDVIELGEFDAGTAVGFAILHQSWNGTTNGLDDPQYTFASRYQLNPETAFPDHIVAVKDDMREMIHFAVEGGLTPEISVGDTDKDFADLFFSVEACNYENLDLEDMSGCLYTTIGCNSVPTGLTVTDIGLWRGTLEWNDLTSADSYRVRFREYGSGDDWDYRNMGTATSFLLSQYNASIKPGTMYEWQVASTCEGVQTGNSVLNIFETRYPCEMPSSSWISDLTSTSVRINWAPVNYATTYKIAYYPTGLELETEWRNAGNRTYFDITGLDPNTEYNYRAGAYCDEFPSCMHPYLHAIAFTTLTSGAAPPMDMEPCVDPRSEVVFEETDSFDLDLEDVQMEWYTTSSGDQLIMTAPCTGGSELNVTALSGMTFGGTQQLTTFEPFDCFDVADMDGNGSSEVLVSQIAGSTASVYGTDGGEFRRQARTEHHGDAGFGGSIFAQLDDDPALEMVAINSNVNKLQIFEPEYIDGREGQELVYRYNPGERLIAYESPTKLSAFDLNGDGLQEIGVGHLSEQFLTVHYNGEAADSLHFTKIPCPLEGPATAMVMGMMDSDADRDMIMISAAGRTLEIYSQVMEAHGPGIGKQFQVNLEHTPSWVRMLDVDANGRQDVIVGYSDVAGITLFQSLSNGDIMLDEGTFIPMPSITTDALVKDLDGDTRQDLVVACTDGTLRIFHNNTYSATELAIVTQKQAAGSWNASVMDVDKSANYHWEFWNGEQYLPLYNSKVIAGAQSTQISLPDTEEMVVRCIETSPCGSVRKSTPLVAGAASDYWKLMLSPNPAKDVTHIRSLGDVNGAVRIEILSLGGRVVYSETMTHAQGPLMMDLRLGSLAPGTYLVRISNQTGSGVERLVIEP